MKKPTKNVVFVMLFSLVMLVGCGQKGPLYLPDGDEQKQAQQK